MLNFASMSQTLPMMAIGMAGIFLVIGVIVLIVMALGRVTGGKKDE